MKLLKCQHKRILSFVLTFALIISIFSIMPLSVSAAIGDVFTVDKFEYTVTGEIYGSYTVCVTGFDNSTNEIIIPEKVTNINTGIEYSVTEIKNTVFQGNTDIVSVNLPGTVKQTSPDCFANCTSLNKITLNEGIEWIVASTFSGTAIEEITFPKSLNKISNYAFEKCLNLKNIYINSDANITTTIFRNSTAIENVYCYSQNIQFKKATLNYTNKTLIIHGYSGSTAETYANTYGYNFSLIEEEPSSETTEPSTEVTEPSTEVTEPSTEVTEPSTEVTEPSTEVTEPSTEVTEPSTEVTEPSTEVTEPSTEVTEPSTEVTEPSSEPDTSIFTWKTINNNTAVEITGIKDEYKWQADVEIPSEINGLPVTVIGVSAFENGQVMYLTIPSSVFIISDKAFYGCGGLTTLTFKENSQLQKIGNQAFARSPGQNDSLSSVELPESLKILGYQAFYNRANLLTVKVHSKDVYFGDVSRGKEVFDLVSGTSNLKLYGYLDSTAQAYATEKEHTFRDIEMDKTPLKELIDTAKAIDSSAYTKESYANLTSELEKANTTYRAASKWEVTHIEVEQAIADLQNAIDNLVVYVAPTTTEPDTTEPTTTEPVTTAPVEIVEYVLGNVDGIDGIKIDDATKIQKYIVGLAELDYADLLAADVNADGKYDITDVTLIQMWIADQKEADGLGIGEKFTKEVTPTQPTDPQPTDPQPTDPQPSDPDMVTFYVPNYVSWLTDLGGKMWVYNDATDEFELMDYDTDFKYFIIDLPSDWTELSLYRTPFEITYDDFDINSPWSDETMSGCILNKWEHLGDRGDNNSFKITGDGEGFYTMFDPEASIDTERTIYFDNSKTKWSVVYIYGWSFGISQEFIPMENEGNDIWSYTFYDDLPVDGVKGFLFVNQPSWSGATQTNDVATEEGKNLFTPIPGGQKLNGSWSVYNP